MKIKCEECGSQNVVLVSDTSEDFYLEKNMIKRKNVLNREFTCEDCGHYFKKRMKSSVVDPDTGKIHLMVNLDLHEWNVEILKHAQGTKTYWAQIKISQQESQIYFGMMFGKQLIQEMLDGTNRSYLIGQLNYNPKQKSQRVVINQELNME